LVYLVVALASALLGGLLALTVIPRPVVPVPPPRVVAQPPEAAPEEAAFSPVVEIAERVGPTVVGVINFKGYDFYRRPVIATGSGIVIDRAGGLVLTNYHLVEGHRALLVTADGGREYEANLVGDDPQCDLALLRIKAARLRQAVLGDSDRLRVGETVVAIGNPLGSQFARSVTVGVVSALNREITVEVRPGYRVNLKVIQTDAAINPGNSGGPLVNLRGEVIGINSVKIAAAGVEGMGFAIPINEVRPLVDELLRNGRVRRPFLGLICLAGAARWCEVGRGLVVDEVFPGSPAEKAGIQPGDVLVRWGRSSLAEPADLERILEVCRPGERVRVQVVRGKRRFWTDLILAEAP
jgi:serine protease Do